MEATDTQEKIIWRQGITFDIFESGVCLETKDMDEETIARFTHEKSMLLVKIVPTQEQTEINCLCHLRWVRKEVFPEDRKFYLGFQFHQIDKKELSLLLKGLKKPHFFRKIYLLLGVFLFALALIILILL